MINGIKNSKIAIKTNNSKIWLEHFDIFNSGINIFNFGYHLTIFTKIKLIYWTMMIGNVEVFLTKGFCYFGEWWLLGFENLGKSYVGYWLSPTTLDVVNSDLVLSVSYD